MSHSSSRSSVINLTGNILNSSQKLNDLLINKGKNILLGLEKDAECKIKLDELKKLILTLEQYSNKSHSLAYIGLLGHFSSGKSSTTNSILQIWDTDDERTTDLHPTDNEITLTTHPDNRNSLFGAIRRGNLRVSTQYIDIEPLKNSVLLDTPGSGEPLILDEMVRDFLPICDFIIYVFSATSPLDNNDIPILKKSHEDLPFIPMKFIVTRANEFIKDKEKGFSDSNVDLHKISDFRSELIARLQNIIPSRRFTENDFLFIDNIYKYNTYNLYDYVFYQAFSTGSLHDHKIKYFMENAKEIRKFFKKYTDDQINSLGELVTIASKNHDDFKKTFLIGKSNLTENWKNIYDELAIRNKRLSSKIIQLKGDLHTPHFITETYAFKDYEKTTSFEINKEIDNFVRRAQRNIEETVNSIISPIKSEMKRLIHNAELDKIDTSQLSSLKIYRYESRESYIPYTIIVEIDSLKSNLEQELNEYSDNINRGISYLINATKNNLHIIAEEKLTHKSQKELEGILNNFYAQVTIYKGAILAINARSIAEELRMGETIDELDNVDLTNEYKQKTKEIIFKSIYSGRDVHIKTYLNNINAIRNDLLSYNTKKPEKMGSSENFHVTNTSNKNIHDFISNLVSNDSIKNISIKKVKLLVSEYQKKSRDEIINERKKFRKRLLARLFGAILVGLAIGTFMILTNNDFIIKIPYLSSILENSIANSIVTQGFFVILTTGITWIFDDSKREYTKSITDIPDLKKSELEKAIDDLDINYSTTINSKKQEIQNYILNSWNSTIKDFKEEIILEYKNYHKDIYQDSEFVTKNIEQYRSSSSHFIGGVMDFYGDIDSNLEILAKTSHRIKDDAIEPSFKMFKNRQNELKEFHEKINNIELI